MTAKSDVVRWALMLVPYNGITFEARWRRAIFVGESSARENFYETFYEALLAMPDLSPKVRRAVMEALGRSLREHNRGIEHAVASTLRVNINERKRAWRERGQRPRGGIHEAAVEGEASLQGMTVDALKKRLQRDKQRQK